MSLVRARTAARSWAFAVVSSSTILVSCESGLLAQEPTPPQPGKAPEAAASTGGDITESPARSTEPLKLAPLRIPNTSIVGIGTGATPENAVEGRLPEKQVLPYGPDRDGEWVLASKTWTAPIFCHQPTYYEDVMLEHHGHERFPKLQPVLSGVRFYSGIFFTPYLAYLHPPLKDVSNAGHYRVGSPAPALRQRAPYDPGAIRFQLLTTGTGVLALQP